jgi:hypothetical protein
MTRWLNLFRLRLRSLLHSADVERDLERELRAHLAAAVDEKVAAGMAPEQARREALREFGSVAAVAEACRDTRRVSWVQNLVRDQAFVRRYFDGQNPVGRDIAEGDRQPMEVVGVVADSLYRSIAEASSPAFYQPYIPADRDLPRMTHLLVRADPAAREGLATAVRDAVRQIDGSAAVTVEPLSSALSFAFLPSRLGAALLGVLGALGTLLAMVGLYGIVSFTVSRRTAELGIRMTLGASRRQLLGLVLRDAGLLVAIGAAVGLGAALFITQPLAAFLVPGLSPADPVSFAATLIVLLLASLLAIWSPAHRATRIEPTVALRAE